MQYDAYKTAGSSPPPDFWLSRQSTVFLLEQLTDAARAWADKHIAANALHFGAAIVIEHRFIDNILAGMRDTDLRVEA